MLPVLRGGAGAFAACGLAAVSSLFTFEFFRFPFQPLREYASIVERARRTIGTAPVGFLGGTLISSNSAWPQDGIDGLKYYRDYVVERRWNMTKLSTQTGVKFVFNPREFIESQALTGDRTFIALNYRPCPTLPLLIASSWHWFDPNRPTFQADIGGEFRSWTFSTGTDPIPVDGSLAGGGV